MAEPMKITARFFARSILLSTAFVLTTICTLTLATVQPASAQTYQVIYNFSGEFAGANPQNGLTVDRGENLYGVTVSGGLQDCALLSECGVVFELSRRSFSGWVLSGGYAFHGYDGACPAGEVAIGADGAVYGTTEFGGPGQQASCAEGEGYGVVYRVRRPTNVTGQWTETVLHAFTGGADGRNPTGPVVFDAEGNLYLTTTVGGINNNGVVAEFTPGQGDWTENVLYSFTGGSDGGYPIGGVTFDHTGNIYGTAGSSQGSQVFQLTLSNGVWTKNTLHQFEHGVNGELIFDPSGNLYGTTGGGYDSSTVFMLSPAGAGWDYSVIYSFEGPTGCGPAAGVIMDAAGKLYGTTFCDGAYQRGSVFKLTPSGGGWTYTSLHDFTGGSDGGFPYDRLAFDVNRNLYGTASSGGTGCYYDDCGVIFEITP